MPPATQLKFVAPGDLFTPPETIYLQPAEQFSHVSSSGDDMDVDSEATPEDGSSSDLESRSSSSIPVSPSPRKSNPLPMILSSSSEGGDSSSGRDSLPSSSASRDRGTRGQGLHPHPYGPPPGKRPKPNVARKALMSEYASSTSEGDAPASWGRKAPFYAALEAARQDTSRTPAGTLAGVQPEIAVHEFRDNSGSTYHSQAPVARRKSLKTPAMLRRLGTPTPLDVANTRAQAVRRSSLARSHQATFGSLAPVLARRIVGFLDTDSLKALALVSRSWRAHAAPVLYESLVFGGDTMAGVDVLAGAGPVPPAHAKRARNVTRAEALAAQATETMAHARRVAFTDVASVLALHDVRGQHRLLKNVKHVSLPSGFWRELVDVVPEPPAKGKGKSKNKKPDPQRQATYEAIYNFLVTLKPRHVCATLLDTPPTPEAEHAVHTTVEKFTNRLLFTWKPASFTAHTVWYVQPLWAAVPHYRVFYTTDRAAWRQWKGSVPCLTVPRSNKKVKIEYLNIMAPMTVSDEGGQFRDLWVYDKDQQLVVVKPRQHETFVFWRDGAGEPCVCCASRC